MMSFNNAAYDRLWHDYTYNTNQPPPAVKYLEYHRERFRETFALLPHLIGDRSNPRMLDVGAGTFAFFYRKLFPNLRWVALDRPIKEGGTPPAFTVDVCGAEAHYEADLTKVTLSPDWGTPPIGKFDLVMCTEVIEHLPVHPVEVIGSLLSLLKDDGYLYLTTPNFFSIHQLRYFAWRHNSVPVFPRRGENADAHHHYREYTLPELVNFVREAGGRVTLAAYSDCWDDDALRHTILAQYPELRSNLRLVAALKHSPDQLDLDAPPFTLAAQNADDFILRFGDWRQKEIDRLRAVIANYERMCVVRLVNFVHHTRLQATNWLRKRLRST